MIKLQKISYSGRSKEVVQGTTYSFSEGHGQLTRAGATVQRGATVSVTVDIEMEVVTNEQTNKWFEKNKAVYTKDQQRVISSHLKEGETSSAWWAIFAWGASGNRSKEEWKTENVLNVETMNEEQTRVVTSIQKMESQRVTVSGKIEITGTSFLPTTAFIFAQITTVHFKDGTSVQVLDNVPTAADSSGNVSGVNVNKGQKLNIIPIK